MIILALILKTKELNKDDDDEDFADELEPLPILEELNEKLTRFESLCDDLLLCDEDFFDDLAETLKFAAPAFDEKDDFVNI